MGMAVMRWLTRSRLTWCAAPAKARATAEASPLVQSRLTLEGQASHTAGAPGAVASSSVAAAGMSWKSMARFSAPSRAAASLVATTMAQGWPTYRTRPSASACMAGKKEALPSALGRFQEADRGATPSAAMSAAVSTATTPGWASAPSRSVMVIAAWARGERTKTAVRTSAGGRSPV